MAGGARADQRARGRIPGRRPRFHARAPRAGRARPRRRPGLIADQSSFVDTRTDEGVACVRRSGVRAVGREGRREVATGRDGDRPADVDAGRAVRDPVDAAGRDRSAETGGRPARRTGSTSSSTRLRGVRRAAIVGGAGTGKTMLAAEKARRLAREGFCTFLVCFNAPAGGTLAETTADVAADTRPPRCHDVPPAVPGPGSVRRGRWGSDQTPFRSRGGTGPPRRARGGWRAAGAAIPRDRRRRRPGLRARVAARARGAVVWRPRRRALRLPRPGPGHLPRGRRGAAGPAGVPDRAELPERAADPRARRAVRGGGAGRRGDARARPAHRSSSRPTARPTRSTPCARSSIDCAWRSGCPRGRSPC